MSLSGSSLENLNAKEGGKEIMGKTALHLSFSLSHGPLRLETSLSRVTDGLALASVRKTKR